MNFQIKLSSGHTLTGHVCTSSDLHLRASIRSLSIDIRFVVLLAKPLVLSTEILLSEGIVSLVGAEV